MNSAEYWGPNQTVEQQLRRVADMTERECCRCLAVARSFTDHRVLAAAKRRANDFARIRKHGPVAQASSPAGSGSIPAPVSVPKS